MKIKIVFFVVLFFSSLLISKAETVPSEPTLSVSGFGESKAKPDIARLSIGVVTKGRTAAEAVSTNAQLAQVLINTLSNLGVPNSDIQTSSLSVLPVYKKGPQNIDIENSIVGYQATNYLDVTIRKINDVGHIIDTVASTGNYLINSISFDLDKPDDFEAEALKKAVADAKRKADIVASAASKSITGIKSITIGSSPNIFSKIAGVADFGASTPILPGDFTISETVSVEYLLDK